VQGNGTSASPLVIIANPSSLSAGTYTGIISLQAGGSVATVPVTLTTYNLPSLSIAASPVGVFTSGQTQAQYALTVSNQAAQSQASGLVTVTMTETSGSSLTLASMSGAGWTCHGNTCTRGDSLLGGSSYPVIIATVNVAAGATLPQTNSAAVSGGNSVSANITFATGVLSPATVSLASQTNPSVFGRAVTLTATVTPSTATGRVTFYEGTTILGIGTVASGVASLSTIMLPADSATLRAYYGGGCQPRAQ
jgi:hypothetical protein